ncbi:MAG: cytochrome bc complex cytochrome b subunit [Burkholderiales bacterium]|nr:cytochrome bc complex cytochrome b subunit [Anaerolineae bacterium]
MSILPFPSILDDVKEKGLKRAVFEAVDDSVQRITAGMNVQDIREALRGEEPSRRPNPRLQPHADGFWLHMRPSYYNRDITGLYPTFRLGWLSTYFVAFETITGIFLMIFYTPSPLVAYSDMVTILSNVPLGQFMRDLHRLGAEGMVLIVTLHMLRTFLTGSYKKPRQFTWFTGVVLFLLTLFLSFSGYLLPWDQLALWAVTIGASMVEAAPPEVVGTNLNLLLRGGPDIGANGLLRFYLLHVLLVPILLIIFLGVHYYKVVVHAQSLPPQKENIGEDTAKRIPLDKRVYFIPDILTSEILWIGVTTFVLIVLCTWFYHAPLENHADPQVTPLGTTAPWYFLFIQGALKLGDKFIWGIAFPTVVFVFMMVYPYIDLNPSRRFRDRPVALSIAMVFASGTVILSYMGLAEFGVRTSADTEVLHEMTMEPAHNHMGVVLPVPYDELVIGAYTTREVEGVEAGEDPRNIIEAFNAETIETGEMALLIDNLRSQHLEVGEVIRFNPLPAGSEIDEAVAEFEHTLIGRENELWNAWGGIIVTQNQEDLKRVDVFIIWDEVQMDNGWPVIGPDGRPLLATQPVAVVDEAGNPVLDEGGNPVMEERPIRRVNSQHVFIHEMSQYFD